MHDAERIWRDRGLRDAVLGGDEAAWRVLYERAYGPLRAFVTARSRAGAPRLDDSRVDEVLQETWMIAVRRIRRFDPGRSAFETWIAGIAWNVLRDARRREARRSTVEPTASDVDVDVDVGGGPELAAPGIDVPGEDAEARSRVSLVLASLSTAYREVLHAKYASGESVAAIAERAGKSPKAVESLLARARDAFRRAYRQLPD